MKIYGQKQLKQIEQRERMRKIKEEFYSSLPLIIMTLIILAAWIWDYRR